MYCPKCGKMIAKDTQFCGRCGMKISVEPVTEQSGDSCVIFESGRDNYSKKAKTNRIIFVTAAVVLVICVTAVAAKMGMSFAKNEEKNDSQINTVSENGIQSTTMPEKNAALAGEGDWRQQYEAVLQELIDGVSESWGFNCAWVCDVNGDGIPMVAVSGMNAAYMKPWYIIDFKNNRVVVKDDIPCNGSGWSYVEELFFVNGTDYIVFRGHGNTIGTVASNEQHIFKLNKYGNYNLISAETVYVSDEMYDLAYDSGYDSAEYENLKKYILDEMDKILAECLNDENIEGEIELLNFDEEVKKLDFSHVFGDEVTDKETQEVIDYLNKELGINLVLKDK